MAADGDPGALAEADAGGAGRVLYLDVGGGVVVDAAEGAATLFGPFEIGQAITDPGRPAQRTGCGIALAGSCWRARTPLVGRTDRSRSNSGSPVTW
ncbi:hypothetical protein [Micromonospora sp. NPDC001898]|uniref:hypothetical protein n=1 Tax=Micromonospora sp. NPDC001898 TaxID=3364221 RepID=UPI0036C2AE93